MTRDAVIIALRAAGCVFAEDEADLLITESGPGTLAAMVARRVAGDPLEYIVGWASFGGLRIALAPGVFVPRMRTELLAETAAALAAGSRERPVVLDMCCGSGAVGAVVRRILPGAIVYAADIDPAAVACAAVNLDPDSVFVGDLYDPLPADVRGRVDVIAANVPYVPSDSIALMPPEARDHEPRTALDGGPDGLDVARRVVAGAAGWLRPGGGSVLFEVGERQVDAAVALLRAHGFTPDVRRDEERGATVAVGTMTRPAAAA